MANELINPNDLPQHLQLAEGQKPEGLESLEGYTRPSFAKIVSPQSHSLKEKFDEGTLISLPEELAIVTYDKVEKRSESVSFVPLLFYAEFTIQNPYQHKTFIREKTFDPDSEIAQRCRSRNKDARTFLCEEQPDPPNNMCSYVERLNFVVILLDHNEDFGEKPIVISCSVGEWSSGSRLISLLQNRQTPNIYASNIFEFFIEQHTNAANTWFGWNFSNPATGKERFVTDPVAFNRYLEMHKKFKESYDTSNLDIDYEINEDKDKEGEF